MDSPFKQQRNGQMTNKTIRLEGSIYFNPRLFDPNYSWIGAPFDELKAWNDHNFIPVAPYTIEIEMPEGFDPMKETLNALQVQRKLILAENEKRLTEIDGKIQELMAIEHKAE
jgi:hypothetical protein